MKKKLLIVAGAGASIEFGMPSVGEINGLFESWAKDYYSLAADPDKSLYTFVRDRVAEYYSKCPKPELAKYVNFEEILYILLQLGSMKNDELNRNPLNAFSNLTDFPEIFWFKQKNQLPTGHDFHYMASLLVDQLLEEFRKRCNRVQTDKKAEFDIFQKFMMDLDEDFEIGIITPNYDNLFKQAIPDLSTGFDETTGEFLPEIVYRNSSWRFCYHIHGSVHFDQIMSPYDMHEIRWQSDLATTFSQNSAGRGGQTTMEGLQLPTSVIVAGYDKSNQIKRNPFRAYFSQLERFALEADAFLFLGYGFADLHLNKCFDRIRNSAKRPVVIIDYAEDIQDPLQFRMDEWSYNLHSAIPFDASKMSCGGRSVAVGIGSIKRLKGFETSNDPNHPLAIWYGGFLKACEQYDKIHCLLSK